MILHTIQMSQWRMAKERKILLVDTTVKSGHKECAPTWEMVRLIKNTTEDDREENELAYTKKYKALLIKSYKENPMFWISLIDNPEVAIACYCKADSFCHRYILKEFIAFLCKRRNVKFSYMGEIKRVKK